MTDTELMQQALDALEKHVLEYETIESLRARLAQPEPYAAQAAMVAGQTQGRMYVDPVTGDAGIGTVKWDASAPLVVHPHPAFQTTEPQEWKGLTEDDAIELLPVMPYEYEVDVEMILEFTKAIEAKLKEKNHG